MIVIAALIGGMLMPAQIMAQNNRKNAKARVENRVNNKDKKMDAFKSGSKDRNFDMGGKNKPGKNNGYAMGNKGGKPGKDKGFAKNNKPGKGYGYDKGYKGGKPGKKNKGFYVGGYDRPAPPVIINRPAPVVVVNRPAPRPCPPPPPAPRRCYYNSDVANAVTAVVGLAALVALIAD